MFDEIYCALSGLPAPEESLLSDIPLEWIRVTVEKQYINPHWAAIQMVKKGLIESTLLSIPEEHREMQRMGIEIQVAAQFHGYEDQFDQFITVSEEVFVSPPNQNAEIQSAWNEISEALGLEEDFGSSLTEQVAQEAKEDVTNTEESAK